MTRHDHTEVTGPIDLAGVEHRLVEAIQDGRLREELTLLLRERGRLTDEAETRARSAAAALAQLDADVAKEGSRVLTAIDAVEISARLDETPRARPLHVVALSVTNDGARKAFGVLEHLGYELLGPSGGGALRAIVATRGRAVFHHRDGLFRVELSWDVAPIWRGFVGRLLVPNQSDLAAVRLPGGAWPAYVVVHLVRLPIRRWWRREPDRGPFLSTPPSLVPPLMAFADLGAEDVLVDLGCGDARLLVDATRHTGCRGRGVESDPELVALARHTVREASLATQVEIVEGDAFTAEIADARVIVAFLPVGILERLLPTVLDRMAPGARVVAHEQERVDYPVPPDARTALITAGGVSVAHRWNR